MSRYIVVGVPKNDSAGHGVRLEPFKTTIIGASAGEVEKSFFLEPDPPTGGEGERHFAHQVISELVVLLFKIS